MLDRSALELLPKEQLIEVVLAQSSQITALQTQAQQLSARVSELEAKPHTKSGSGTTPPIIRASVRRKQEKQERKKRAQSFTRKRETPTQDCVHAASHCPDCGRLLSGGTVHRRRQVIDIPPVTVQVTDHVLLARWCGVCRKRVLPSVDLSAEAVGQHRLGLRLTSLIAHLKTTTRLPVRQITALLRALFGVRVSMGEVCALLHAVAARGMTEYGRLQASVRGSPYVHADETGWREDGQNGYLWSFSTPEARLFVYNQSRAGSVPQEVLGDEFGGICVSDFYGGYNGVGQVRQRCWVHFLRDLRALTQAHPDTPSVQAHPDTPSVQAHPDTPSVQAHPDTPSVQTWAAQVRQVYDEARAYQDQARAALARHGQAAGHFGFGVFDRRRRRQEFEEQLYALALPYLKQDVPQRVLSERIAHFLGELFVFVEHPSVPSENNAAERSVRPAVIARKISGGTRSSQGSSTKSVLLSLFGTWQAQGIDPLEACRQMLMGIPSQEQTSPASP